MAKRIVGDGPRIVGKPLDGPEGSPLKERSEAAKLEIQVALKQIIESLNDAQEKIEELESQNASSSGSSSLAHFFTLGT